MRPGYSLTKCRPPQYVKMCQTVIYNLRMHRDNTAFEPSRGVRRVEHATFAEPEAARDVLQLRGIEAVRLAWLRVPRTIVSESAGNVQYLLEGQARLLRE